MLLEDISDKFVLRTSEDHKLQRRNHRELIQSKLAGLSTSVPRCSKGLQLVQGRNIQEQGVGTFASTCLAHRSDGLEHNRALVLSSIQEPEQGSTSVLVHS